MAASMAMMAMTPIISRRVNPSWPLTLSLGARGRNIGRRPGSALLPVCPVRDDFIRAAFSRRAIDVRLAPGVVRHVAAFQIGTIPCRQTGGGLDERGQPLRGGRVAPGVEVEQIERAR